MVRMSKDFEFSATSPADLEMIARGDHIEPGVDGFHNRVEAILEIAPIIPRLGAATVEAFVTTDQRADKLHRVLDLLTKNL